MTDARDRERPGPHDEVPVRVSGLRTAFGDTVIHDGLDLEVRRGEILGLVGGSGTGKSVLLNAMLGLRPPDGGRIEVLGRDVNAEAERPAIRRRIGVLFQGGALFSALTVRQNVEAPMIEHTSLSRDFVTEVADFKIALAGLPADAGDKFPAELSGGMRKRAGIARAIALDPEILFLDEPTAGLDPIGAHEFDTLVRGLHEALGLSVLMITHDVDSLYAICDRVAVLADRKVVAVEPAVDLERSDHPWIREYFGGPRGRAASGRKK